MISQPTGQAAGSQLPSPGHGAFRANLIIIKLPYRLCRLYGETGSLWSLLGLLGASAPNRTRSRLHGTPWTTPHLPPHPPPTPLFSKHLSSLCGPKTLQMPLAWKERNISGSKPNIQTHAFWHPQKSRGVCSGREKVLEIGKCSAQVKSEKGARGG